MAKTARLGDRRVQPVPIGHRHSNKDQPAAPLAVHWSPRCTPASPHPAPAEPYRIANTTRTVLTRRRVGLISRGGRSCSSLWLLRPVRRCCSCFRQWPRKQPSPSSSSSPMWWRTTRPRARARCFSRSWCASAWPARWMSRCTRTRRWSAMPTKCRRCWTTRCRCWRHRSPNSSSIRRSWRYSTCPSCSMTTPRLRASRSARPAVNCSVRWPGAASTAWPTGTTA